MKRILFIAMIILLVGCTGDKTEPVQTKEKDNDKVEAQEEKETNESEEVTTTSYDADEEEEEEEEDLELTPRDQMIVNLSILIDEGEAFDTGSYVKGDIPKGDYAFVTFEGSGQYYSEEDSAGNIIDNENFDSFGYVKVHEAGNIKTDGVLVKMKALKKLEVSGAKELYEIINETENYTESGWYKIGVDLKPGEYVIESFGDGYVAVMNGPIGNSDIHNNENFNGKYSVNVKEGQYLVISRGTISN